MFSTKSLKSFITNTISEIPTTCFIFECLWYKFLAFSMFLLTKKEKNKYIQYAIWKDLSGCKFIITNFTQMVLLLFVWFDGLIQFALLESYFDFFVTNVTFQWRLSFSKSRISYKDCFDKLNKFMKKPRYLKFGFLLKTF